MSLFFWILAVAAGLFGLDRILLWAEARGWIYWRKVKPKHSGSGDAFLSLGQAITPSASYISEAKQATKSEERDNGDPPKPAS